MLTRPTENQARISCETGKPKLLGYVLLPDSQGSPAPSHTVMDLRLMTGVSQGFLVFLQHGLTLLPSIWT